MMARHFPANILGKYHLMTTRGFDPKILVGKMSGGHEVICPRNIGKENA
jgi:hypothetical protein